jgi:hypothetical protein
MKKTLIAALILALLTTLIIVGYVLLILQHPEEADYSGAAGLYLHIIVPKEAPSTFWEMTEPDAYVIKGIKGEGKQIITIDGNGTSVYVADPNLLKIDEQIEQHDNVHYFRYNGTVYLAGFLYVDAMPTEDRASFIKSSLPIPIFAITLLWSNYATATIIIKRLSKK